MLKKWEILHSKNVFKCPWFTISQESCKLPDGEIIDDYYITNCKDVATVIAFVEEDKIITLKEYKHGYKDIIYTFPSGMVEVGEDHKDGAERELLEETGFSGELTFIDQTSPNPTSARFKKYVYIAKNLKKIQEPELEKTEFIEVEFKTIKEIHQMIKNNQMVSDLNITSFYSAMNYLGKLSII